MLTLSLISLSLISVLLVITFHVFKILIQGSDTFVDSMDPINYVQVKLQKPMGIIFEENEGKVGGIFVVSLKEGGIAEKNGHIKAGDQLVAVNDSKVAGMTFDEALGTIVATETPETKLILFRGSAQQLYGPLGASKAWLDEFVS